MKKLHSNNCNENMIINNNENNTGSTESTGGASRALRASRIIKNYNDKYNDENTEGQQSCNRTLIFGPSFCGKTNL